MTAQQINYSNFYESTVASTQIGSSDVAFDDDSDDSEDEETLMLKPIRPTLYKVLNIVGIIVITTLLFIRHVL